MIELVIRLTNRTHATDTQLYSLLRRVYRLQAVSIFSRTMDFTTIDVLLNSPDFQPDSADDQAWRDSFAELIRQVNPLLVHLTQTGQRIDFMQGVGVHGKLQDITSLVHWMHQHLPQVAADKPGQWPKNRLNRYFNEGWGRFANGHFFANEFDGELAFFIDDQRIYLNHHLRRAVDQAKYRLTN